MRRVVDAVPARDGREPADAEAVDVGEAREEMLVDCVGGENGRQQRGGSAEGSQA